MAVTWIDVDDMQNSGDPMAPAAAEAASWLLWKLSGEKYGGIRTTVEWYGYADSACWCNSLVNGDIAHLHRLVSMNGDRAHSTRLRLRSKPVQSVSAVTLSSESLSVSSYQLYNDATLVRTDGQPWNLNEGVEVAYTYGTRPPVMGRNAAIRLADELVLAACGSDRCSLPDRVTSVSRQGVSFTVLDPQDFLKDGRTGIYEIDLFLAAANPSHARKRAKVFSPDVMRGERRR